jgi:hypothetical protein
MAEEADKTPRAGVAPISEITTAQMLLVRLQGLEKAQELFREDIVRVPTNVDRATQQLEELVDARLKRIESIDLERVSSINDKLNRIVLRLDDNPNFVEKEINQLRVLLQSESKRLEDVSDQRFLRIDAGLLERDKRADQLALANSAALAAALAAQKEAAGEAQKSAATAISKSEAATAEAIKQGQTLFQTGLASLTNQVTDLKSRLDKGEGGRVVSDPATAMAISELNAKMSVLSTLSDNNQGSRSQKGESINSMWALLAAIAAFALVAVDLLGVFHK